MFFELLFHLLIAPLAHSGNALTPVITSDPANIDNLPNSFCALFKTTEKESVPKTFCSASVVEPQRLLTAAHCFLDGERPKRLWFSCKKRPKIYDDLIGFTEKQTHLEKTYRDKEIDRDIAIVTLPENVRATPVRLAKTKDEAAALLKRDKCVIAGFGIDKDKGTGILVAGYSSPIDRSEAEKEYIKAIFGDRPISDGPLAPLLRKQRDYAVQEDLPDRPLIFSGGKKTQFQMGDSGGPYLCQNQEGIWIQVGVISRAYGKNLQAQYLASGTATDVAVQVFAPVYDQPLIGLQTAPSSAAGSGTNSQPAK